MLAKRSYSEAILPVPAGISLPSILFSFKPFIGSIVPCVAASDVYKRQPYALVGLL